MLDLTYYDLLAKYDSMEELPFDANELTIISSVLNLDIASFSEARLAEYREFISRVGREQNRTMTEIGGEYLNRVNEGSDLEAFRYVVQNLDRIRSPYMLNILVSLLSDNAE